MKVLFFMRSTVYVRNFESTLRLLAERGHQVHVVAEMHQVLDPTDVMGRLGRECPGITYTAMPPSPSGKRWSQLGIELRRAIDYLRYRQPEFRDAPKLRWRAELKLPVFIATRTGRWLTNSAGGSWLWRRFLRWCDRALPVDAALRAFIGDERPDVVVVTPLVEPGSPQSAYLRAARALGLPTALCVYSWDNLTSKGLIHDPVDLVTVWNRQMKDEAVQLHGVPATRVVVTGAAAYDHWFTWKPRTTRESFCARVGLNPQHPYLLYLCSSRFIAGNEVPFVRRWVHDVRASSEALREVGVLVRPHPQNAERWVTADLSDLGNVAVWPRDGANPADPDTRADYYDSIFHSTVVVGINTSALIESAIVGRGVYTLRTPEYRDAQEGTLHFRYLRDVNGGLLHVASDPAEHVSQLEAVVKNPSAADERCRRFVDAFVRPHGIEEAATPRLVAAIEALAAAGLRRPAGRPWWSVFAQPVLARMATVVQHAAQAAAEAGAEEKKRKQLDQEQRAARGHAQAAEAALVVNSASQAFEHYLRVRDTVRRLSEAAPANGGVTPSEQRMLAGVTPLWDAGPDAIALLRQHATAVSGISAADYDEDVERTVKFRFERDLRRLLARGDETLWIDEPPVLGAFGFSFNNRRFNEDTLRSFRVISLLQDAALLAGFRHASPRPTVWEIGGGWGGFAYHFKTLCPDVTYLITGRPELFLLSAVYLMTLFPAARFRFFDPDDPGAFWHDWSDVDFAFAPESVVPRMQPPSLALTVDLMALERMSAARVCLHVQRAYDLGSRYIASICPAGAPDPDHAAAVRPALDRFYWAHPVCAPESLARRLSLPPDDGPVERTYFLGWKRLRA